VLVRSTHRPGAELPVTVRQLGPATSVSLGKPDLQGRPRAPRSGSLSWWLLWTFRTLSPSRRPGAWAAAWAAGPGTACRLGPPLL